MTTSTAQAWDSAALEHAAGSRRFAFVAPRHADDPDWPWLSQVGPMRRHHFERVFIDNTFSALPKATRPHVRWQYLKAMRAIANSELAFLFSTDIGLGLTSWPAPWLKPPKRVYVGFTQDGNWSESKVDRLSTALQRCDAVTVFSNDERDLYLDRFSLNPQQVHLIPIHTDETGGYRQYSDQRPMDSAYVLSLGSPNRRFAPLARAC